MTDAKAYSALKQTVLMVFVSRGLAYISSVLLLIILSPDDFGRAAVVLAIVAILNATSAFGLDAALIARSRTTKLLYDVAWTIETIKGFTLFLGTYFAAGLLTTSSSGAWLAEYLNVASYSFLLQSSKNIGLVAQRKNLDFHSITICEIMMAISNATITILLALFGYGAMSIVFGYVSGWCVYFLLSFALCSYRPSIKLHKIHVLYLMSYSRWVIFSGHLNALLDHGVTLVIARLGTIEFVGQFERADLYSRKLLIQAGELIWRFGLPYIASQDDHRNQQTVLERGYLAVSFISPIILVTGSILITNIVSLYSFDDWGGLKNLLMLCSIIAYFYILPLPAQVLFQAINRPELGLYLTATKFLCLVVYAALTIGDLTQASFLFALLATQFLGWLMSIWLLRCCQFKSQIHQAFCSVFYFILMMPGLFILTLDANLTFVLMLLSVWYLFYFTVSFVFFKDVRTVISLAMARVWNKVGRN